MRLKGRVAIVTGAGTGLGRATAELFAAEGARVVVADHDEERAKSVARGIDGEATAVRVDVTRRDAVRAMVDAARSRFGPVEILINSAGIAHIAPFLEIGPADWERMLAVHLTGTFVCSQAVLPDMLEAKWGRIVNTSSVAGMVGGPLTAHYAAAKAAIIGLTRSLALELARTGITVNAVAPGLIDNVLSAVSGDAPPSTIPGQIPKEHAGRLVEYFTALTPMRRAGEPLDIAHAHLFLASAEAGFVTGQVLSPNGGFVF